MLLEEFEWKPEYKLDVAIIDDAHREIFNMAKRLYLASYMPDKRALGAKSSLRFLKSYVAHHFAEEEAYMRATVYPGLERHTAQHRHFREVMVPRLEQDLKGELYSDDAIYSFLNIIRLWLSNHILEHDLDIGRRT